MPTLPSPAVLFAAVLSALLVMPFMQLASDLEKSWLPGALYGIVFLSFLVPSSASFAWIKRFLLWVISAAAYWLAGTFAVQAASHSWMGSNASMAMAGAIGASVLALAMILVGAIPRSLSSLLQVAAWGAFFGFYFEWTMTLLGKWEKSCCPGHDEMLSVDAAFIVWQLGVGAVLHRLALKRQREILLKEAL